MLLCAVKCAVLHIDIRNRVAIVRKDGLSVKIGSMELNHIWMITWLLSQISSYSTITVQKGMPIK